MEGGWGGGRRQDKDAAARRKRGALQHLWGEAALGREHPAFLVLATGYFGAAHRGRGGQIYTFHH